MEPEKHQRYRVITAKEITMVATVHLSLNECSNLDGRAPKIKIDRQIDDKV